MRPRILVPCVLALVLAGAVALSLASRRRPAAGLVDGALRPCPERPACVSSQAPEGPLRVDPLLLRDDPHAAFGRAVGIVDAWPRTTLVTLTERYAHFELVTPFLRCREDLELALDPEARVLHVRSAARVGTFDFGSSRARVDRLRRALEGR